MTEMPTKMPLFAVVFAFCALAPSIATAALEAPLLTNVTIYDQVNGWGLRYQPFLYEMIEAIGDYPRGTLLLAANSIPADLSETQIDLYASTDKGYVSSMASNIIGLP